MFPWIQLLASLGFFMQTCDRIEPAAFGETAGLSYQITIQEDGTTYLPVSEILIAVQTATSSLEIFLQTDDGIEPTIATRADDFENAAILPELAPAPR